MKGFIIAILLLTASTGLFGQNQSVTVKSPNNRLTLTVFTANKKLLYSLNARNTAIINTSALGLLADNMDLGDKV